MVADVTPEAGAARRPSGGRGTRASSARFWWGLGGLAAAGLVLRLLVVLLVHRDDPLQGDDFYYYWQARALASGHWFVDPFAWAATGEAIPAAGHPPLYPGFLGLVSLVTGTGVLPLRLATAALGAGTVVAVGVLARRLVGDRAGWIAGGIAAVYPNLWINDAQLLAEALYALTIALVLLAAYRFWAAPGRLRAAVLGLSIAVATLTRAEALLLVPLLLGAWLLLGHPGRPAVALRTAAITVLAAVVVVAPWVGRNLATFERPVTVSSGLGNVLASANCDATYSGDFIGLFSIDCLIDDLDLTPQQREQVYEQGAPALAARYREAGEESVTGARMQRIALDYMREHWRRVPVVMAVRVGRAWDLFRPAQGVRFNAFVEGRGRVPSRLGLMGYWLLVAFGLAGLLVARRRRIPLGPMICLAIMVTVDAALSMGLVRYRVPLDVALVVLAAVGVDALADRIGDRAARRPAAGEPDRRSVPVG